MKDHVLKTKKVTPLIILEGIKGSGKSTISKYLAEEYLEDATILHFPLNQRIRKWTKSLDRSSEKITNAEKMDYAYMQAIDKFLALSPGSEIEIALKKGPVIIDRFIDSFFVNQKGDIDAECFNFIINETNRLLYKLPAFVIHLYLDCSIETAETRIQKRTKLDDRFIEQLSEEKEAYDEIWVQHEEPVLTMINGGKDILDKTYQKNGIIYVSSLTRPTNEVFIRVNTDLKYDTLCNNLDTAMDKLTKLISTLNK